MDGDLFAVVGTQYDTDGFLTVKVASYGEGDSTAAPYEKHHMHGFLSLPMPGVIDTVSNDADGSNSSVGYVLTHGVRAHALIWEDPRTVPVLPKLKNGESIMYGSSWGQFVRCHADGSISMVTASKSAYDGTGQPLHLWIRPTGLEFVAQWGRLVFDQTGFHLQHISGATFDLGSIGGMPTPLNGLSSYCAISAGMLMGNVSASSHGASGAQQPVALSFPLLLQLGTMQAAIVAIQAALATATPASGITPAQLGVVNAAIAAATAGMALATTAIPSPSLAG